MRQLVDMQIRFRGQSLRDSRTVRSRLLERRLALPKFDKAQKVNSQTSAHLVSRVRVTLWWPF